MDVSSRRATLDDVPFLAALAAHADVEPFLAVSRASTPEAIAERVARSQREPDGFGVLVIEADGEPVGTMSWELVNRRSRIAAVSGLAVDPGFRERGVGIAAAKALQRHLFAELGFHRLQMEVYGFNERGLRHAERVGWVREGVRRRAYWRDEAWVDGVLFGLVDGRVRRRLSASLSRPGNQALASLGSEVVSRHPPREGVAMAFLVALAVFVAAILVGVVLFVTGHVVLGLCALLASLPFALASWVKWADRGI